MMSPDERLVYMANQIARNLAAQGRETAVTMLLEHIAAFWDPHMKAKLVAMHGAALDPIAADAVTRLARHIQAVPTSDRGASDAG